MKKICVFTGTRAEYGLLKPLIQAISDDKDLELQLIVTGMHLSPEFGLTYKEIEKDGFKIDEKFEILLSSDSPVGLAKSLGLCVISSAESLNKLKPDLLVVLGDRFESLGIASAAMLHRIPIAHLYGGEATFGLIDEAIRHSITKMSHIHFSCTEEYRRRIIQLGENPERVFNVGALAIDIIKRIKLLNREELEANLGVKFRKRNLLVTFHPVTLENQTSQAQFTNLLTALDSLEDTFIIFTKANADTDGRIINSMIDEYVVKNSEKSAAFYSLGHLRYLSVMNLVDGVVGNSSSGIVEAPAMKTGTVNIGDRQSGRIRAGSIIDSNTDTNSIKMAVEKLLSEKFQKLVANVDNPYGDGNTTEKIMNVFRSTSLDNLLKKEFYDLDQGVK